MSRDRDDAGPSLADDEGSLGRGAVGVSVPSQARGAGPARRGSAIARTCAWLRRASAPLPVRFDHWHFWPRAALGLVLRWAVLEGSFWPLREAVTSGVAWTLALVGVGTTRVSRATLTLERDWFHVTVSCTHLELLVLLAPLMWDRSQSVARNVALLGAFGVSLLAFSIVRIDLGVVLLRAGVPWIWGHDVLLGVFYFALIALVLSRGAWTRPSAPSSAPAG